jgi:hypothetical protein
MSIDMLEIEMTSIAWRVTLRWHVSRNNTVDVVSTEIHLLFLENVMQHVRFEVERQAYTQLEYKLVHVFLC